MHTLLLILFLAFTLPSSAEARPPNVVVIFMDDMGYADIGPFGAKAYPTPHLDRMAKEGRKFTDFYVTQAVCSASRAGLLTGCYNVRLGILGALGPRSTHGIAANEVTLAEICKQKGYATACYGKWHLGHHKKFLPKQHGFDEYFGIPYSNDMWPYHPGVRHLPMAERLKRWPHLPLIDGNAVINPALTGKDQEEITTQLTERAVSFIEKNKGGPFFAYVPHAFVHGPRKARPEFMAKAKTVEEAQVEECDWSAGQILDAVRKAGIEKNTFVLFTSDNGGARGLSSGPLRGGKGSMWEGGFRGPAVAWWPGTIPAGSTCSEMASTMDLMPTFAKWAGGKVPDDRVIDGKEVSDLFLGKEGAKTPHDRFFFNARNTLRAVRSGPWKLFLNGPLHNLDENLGETKNYASKRPGVVKRLKGYMAEFERDLKKNSRPVGVAKNPKTLVPRPGAKGEDAYTPTLWIGKKK